MAADLGITAESLRTWVSKDESQAVPGRRDAGGARRRSWPTTDAYGRYAFTVTGTKDVTEKDTAAFRAGDDLGEFAFRQIRRSGEAQASAAAAR